MAYDDFAGDFETHVTVSLDRATDAASLRAWGERRGLKFTHIMLARGKRASQPMLTREARATTLPAELAAATALADTLRAERLDVCRVKIEASPWNAEVPQTDGDALLQPADRHFEHHVKLLLASGADLGPLIDLAIAHDAHVSRNALRARGDGRQERFVTQRCYGVGLSTAAAKHASLVDTLRAQRYDVLDEEREYVVYDSNAELDAGWIELDAVTGVMKGGPR
jgi:hypothetical protein